MKIPDSISKDLDLNSDLQYLLPQWQGPGLCATGLVCYLVALQNELAYAVDSHTGEDSRYITYKYLHRSFLDCCPRVYSCKVLREQCCFVIVL